jgi:hypothetical protein
MTAVGVDAIHSRIHAGQHRIVGMNTNIIYIHRKKINNENEYEIHQIN